MLLKNNTMKLALCGTLTALCAALMFMTGVFPLATYALPAAAGLVTVVAVIEAGRGWAWAVYAASALLSLLLAGDKEAVLLYVLFFGYYPVIKAVLEHRTQKKWLLWLCKLLVFNVAMLLDFLGTIYVLGVPKESYELFGLYLPLLFLALGNVVFVVYDYAVSCGVLLYWRRIHPVMKKLLKLN